MKYRPPEYEIDDLVRHHSHSFRIHIKEIILKTFRPGEQFSTKDVTRSLEAMGYDIKDLPWWRDGEFMSTFLEKVGRGKWRKTT